MRLAYMLIVCGQQSYACHRCTNDESLMSVEADADDIKLCPVPDQRVFDGVTPRLAQPADHAQAGAYIKEGNNHGMNFPLKV